MQNQHEPNELESEIFQKKLQSINKKEGALNALYEEVGKIHKEIREWYNEDRYTRDQKKLNELQSAQQKIAQQQYDLCETIEEEREALFPTTPEDLSAEVVIKTTGEAEQELSITELTGDNGPAENTELTGETGPAEDVS